VFHINYTEKHLIFNLTKKANFCNIYVLAEVNDDTASQPGVVNQWLTMYFI
jgi:hypothetical protein